MTDRPEKQTPEEMREVLKQQRAYFEQREQEMLKTDYREPTDEEKLLFDDYMHNNFAYGERREDRETMSIVFYRKLLRLPENPDA